MTDFLTTNPLPISFPEPPKLLFPFPKPNSHAPFSPKLAKPLSAALSSSSNGSSRMPGPSNSRGYNFYNQLQFDDDRKAKTFGLESNNHVDEDSLNENGSLGLRGLEDSDGGSRKSEKNDLREEDLVRIQGDADDGVDLKKDDQVEKFSGKLGFTRVKREILRRSNLLAKQVITVRSALSLGFVSQLWVDTTSWMVLFVEVRPNLLSGDSEKFLLEDISQVGDVVLVQDESVIENEFKMVGLETLVGYKVVTPSQRNIGKVRGYTFNINSGAVEELELDSFGLSIIPSSVVSTYSLLVEDVLEVVSDAVVVHEAAAKRIQRLSKGFLGNQTLGNSIDDVEGYDSEQSLSYGHVSRRRKSFGRKKPNRRDWDDEDNWELPMDYL